MLDEQRYRIPSKRRKERLDGVNAVRVCACVECWQCCHVGRARYDYYVLRTRNGFLFNTVRVGLTLVLYRICVPQTLVKASTRQTRGCRKTRTL